jgi:2,3-bisphosphoglycerate-independent phosphoglycerate mutase
LSIGVTATTSLAARTVGDGGEDAPLAEIEGRHILQGARDPSRDEIGENGDLVGPCILENQGFRHGPALRASDQNGCIYN